MSLDPYPGVPTSADPVEVLAYALWNDGHKDEAIAVLERQIALEKKLAEGGLGLPSPEAAPPDLPERNAFAPPARPTPAIVPPAGSAQNRTARKPAASTMRGRALTVVSAIPRAPAAVNDPRPGMVNSAAQWNTRKPGRGLAWLFGLLLTVAGIAGLWANLDRDATEVAEPATREMPSEAAQPPAQVAKGAALPATEAEPEAQALETPAEEVLDTPPVEDDTLVPAPEAAKPRPRPAEEVLDSPPAEDIVPAPVPRVATPRPRPARQQPATARPSAVEPPPEEPVAAPVRRAPTPPSTTRPRPPEEDARAARARRLAERREAAERYVARRRAEAERRAAQRRGAAAPPPAPTREGPSILLGGRGLPD